MKILYSDLKALGDTMNIVITGQKQVSAATSSRSSSTLPGDVASGIKTRKKRNIVRKKRLTIVKREDRPRRFKRPFFLSLK
jgi:hypothetical protein